MPLEFMDLPGLGQPVRGADGILRWGTCQQAPLVSPQTPGPREQPGPTKFPGWFPWLAGACIFACVLSLLVSAVTLGLVLSLTR